MGRRSSTRAAPSTPITTKKQASSATSTPGRQSKRLKSASEAPKPTGSKSTPTKSKYFEHDNESSEPHSSPSPGVEESGYEDDDASVELTNGEATATEAEEDEDFSEEDEKPRKRKRSTKPKSTAAAGVIATAVEKGKELWREGVKVGLGRKVWIETPKGREPGKTPYKKETIHPNTFLFLADLKENNDREWMKSMSKIRGSSLCVCPSVMV